MKNKVFNAIMLVTTVPINKEDLFIVWSCYILGNHKFLVGCVKNSQYYEVTYDKETKRWYVDEYTKVQNKCIFDKTLNEYTEINSKI